MTSDAQKHQTWENGDLIQQWSWSDPWSGAYIFPEKLIQLKPNHLNADFIHFIIKNIQEWKEKVCQWNTFFVFGATCTSDYCSNQYWCAWSLNQLPLRQLQVTCCNMKEKFQRPKYLWTSQLMLRNIKLGENIGNKKKINEMALYLLQFINISVDVPKHQIWWRLKMYRIKGEIRVKIINIIIWILLLYLFAGCIWFFSYFPFFGELGHQFGLVTLLCDRSQRVSY